MRIGIASSSYYPWPGGVTEHVAGSAAALRRLGHTVHVLTAGTLQPEDGPDVHRVARRMAIPWKGATANLSFGWRLTRRLAALYRSLELDVVHVHAPLAPGLPIGAVLAARQAGIPVAATFHAAADSDLPYLVFNPWLRRVAERLDLRLAVSEPARDLVQRYFPGRYRVLPNGVDVARFSPGAPPARLGPGPTVVCVGRLDPRKGVAHLIDALPALAAQVPDVRLVVVGDGPLRRRLARRARRTAPERVSFRGAVAPGELAGYYTGADAVCCPATHNESFGIVILEAMACGRPVVATGIPGYRVLMRDDENGRVVAPGRPEALTEALIDVLLHSERARRMGARGRETALGYSWKLVGEKLQSCYEELVTRGPGLSGGGAV
jgi:phosphatidylinositol alpha-mannosyltransferase